MKQSVQKYLLISVLLFLAAGSLSAQDGYTLIDLEFEGNINFSDSEIEEKISVYSVNSFEVYILQKDRFVFSRDMLTADIKNLVRFYQQEGYLGIRIDYSVQNLNSADQTLDLLISIIEGAPVLVDSVSFRFVPDSATAEKLDVASLMPDESKLSMRKGERFRDALVESDQKRIVKQYLDSGYPYVEVKPDIVLDKTNESVGITWLITPGPASRFGDIIILGSDAANTDHIRDKLAFGKGETFRQSLIDTTSQSLYSLGLFQVVGMKALLEEKNPTVPVTITVKEAPRTTTRFGVGYGSEEKLRLHAEIRRLRFLGGLRQIQLFGRHSALEPYHIDLKFTQPEFLFESLNLILNPFLRKQDEPGFKVSRKGFRSTFLYPLPFKLNSSLTYTFEAVNQDTVDYSSGKLPGDDFKGLYDKSMIGLGLTRDTSEPMLYPRRGKLISINVQYNGITSLAEYPFLKTLIDLRLFTELHRSVLAGRVKVGGIRPQSGNDYIPVEERFYSGGSYSNRGWARSELGPRDEQGIPTGGNSLLEMSLELRYPVYGLVSGVVFSDFGNVWSTSFTYLLNELRYSVGIGVRIKTPIGPIRFDAARPVFDPEKQVQFHFSVGHSF